MTPGFAEDQPLFSTDMMEGEYTTWAFLWSRDIGAGNDFDSLYVDNYGWCYLGQSGPTVGYIRDRLGNETLTANQYWTQGNLDQRNKWNSVNCKYIIGLHLGDPSIFRVFRRGVEIFNHDLTTDEPTVTELRKAFVSANGRYILAIGFRAGDMRYAMLYEGS